MFLTATHAVMALSTRSHEPPAKPNRPHGIVPVAVAAIPAKTAASALT